jgi:hypothetical protein
MPLQSRDSINSGDDCLRRAAKANGGDGVIDPFEMKVGCYCYSQNYFGDEWNRVLLVCRVGDGEG